MDSWITLGYGRFDRIITLGFGSGWLGILRAEVLRFVSKFTKRVELTSKFNKGC